MFSDLKFRASGVGHLMTSPRTKADKEAGNLSESAKTNCIDVFISKHYGRNTEISTKYTEKGNQVEEDSITIYSRLHKQFYKKNDKRLENDYVSGTPDIYEGENIHEAKIIIDIKSSWDIYTFHRTNAKPINPLYWWQLQTYMWLTGATEARLAYCLVDTPPALIEDEKRKLFYRMGAVTMEDPLYLEACEELEKLMVYGDIPLHERLIEYQIPRDDNAINQIAQKVVKAREFITQYYQQFNPPTGGVDLSKLKKIA